MTIYKFLPTKYALDVIRNKSLKLTSYPEINDLYEFKGLKLIDWDGKTKDPSGLFKKYVLGCFSKNYNNPTMWSHYGDSHRGIVLGFNPSEDLIKNHFHTVEYRNEIELISNYRELDESIKIDTLLKLLEIKSVIPPKK